MTKWEALIKCRNHWQWLVITGSPYKGSYMKAARWPYECIACKHAGTKGSRLSEDNTDRDCSKCVLTGYAWRLYGDGRGGLSSCGRAISSVYFDWTRARTTVELIEHANKMVNACNKAIEDLIVFGKLRRNYL